MVVISAAVEGVVDETVIKSLITEAGALTGQVYGKKGKPSLRASIAGYNMPHGFDRGLCWWIWTKMLLARRSYVVIG
jgi:hypothetical protein